MLDFNETITKINQLTLMKLQQNIIICNFDIISSI